MTSQSSTPTPALPLLTEQELFRRFLKTPITRRTSTGAVAQTYNPEDWLRDPGMHGTFEPLAGDIAAELESEGTEDALRDSAADHQLRGQLQLVMADDFQQFKERYQVDPDDDLYYDPDEIVFLGDGSTPAPEHPDGFIGEDEDTGVGAPPA